MFIQHREHVSVLITRQRKQNKAKKPFLLNQYQLFAQVPEISIKEADLYNILQTRYFIFEQNGVSQTVLG